MSDRADTKPGPELDRAVAVAISGRAERYLRPSYSTDAARIPEMVGWLTSKPRRVVDVGVDVGGAAAILRYKDIRVACGVGDTIQHALALLVVEVARSNT